MTGFGWVGYALFAAATCVVSVFSILAAFFNPVTHLFLLASSPPIAWLGRQAPQGWSALGPAMIVSGLWPLTLAPVHWINFRILKWGGLGYILLFVAAGLFIAFCAQLAQSAPRQTARIG